MPAASKTLRNSCGRLTSITSLYSPPPGPCVSGVITLTNLLRNLEPGGYLELQDVFLPYGCDDGTMTADSPLYRASALCVEGAAVSGRRIDLAPEYKTYLERAGFVDVVERRFKWPLNEWPKHPHYKLLGAWTRECLDKGAEGLVMALLTRNLQWTKER